MNEILKVSYLGSSKDWTLFSQSW